MLDRLAHRRKRIAIERVPTWRFVRFNWLVESSGTAKTRASAGDGSASMFATGASGGAGNNAADGGVGATVLFVGAVAGAISGSLSLQQTAIGGLGRWGEVGGRTILDKNPPVLKDSAQSGPYGPAFQE